MKNNKILGVILSIILLALVGSAVYVNFLAKDSSLVSYILLGEIMLGILSSVITLFLCVGKKSYKVLLISFFQILFTIGVVILNTVYGYAKLIDFNSFNQHMEYISMNMNVYLFIIFGVFMGLFTLDQYIKSFNEKPQN